MKEDPKALHDELKRLEVGDLSFAIRKIWYCLIQALEHIDKIEEELEDIKYRYELRQDLDE